MSFFQNLLMKKMLKSQMKGVPEAEQQKMMDMVEQNPDLFMNIAKEVEAKMKEGKDQRAATMEVVQKYQADLKGLLK
jgi:hypothetical protein